VRVEESSYRREGARMLVFESGVFEGGISGGCLEGDALQRSQMAILKQQPSIVTYDTSREKEIGVGLGCNGIIDVLISPVSGDSPLISMLEECVAARDEHLIATVTALQGKLDSVSLGQSFYYDPRRSQLRQCPEGAFRDFIEGRIGEVRRNQKSRTYTFESPEAKADVFVELIPPQIHLALYGDNYDVYPLIEMARVMDWEVSLVGNIQKLKKDRLHTVANLYPKELEARPEIDHRTAVLLMAHDFKTDSANLLELIKSPAPYIASLGPRKRFVKMLADFESRGIRFSAAQSDRIYAPCGLEIGANTPEEIAASIFAEILGVFAGKAGGMLRDKKGPIHERE
jgi:xanthine/CO dehydrogenase XdhC/CoxF family maturation factor